MNKNNRHTSEGAGIKKLDATDPGGAPPMISRACSTVPPDSDVGAGR
jgi:hypothetical protein